MELVSPSVDHDEETEAAGEAGGMWSLLQAQNP